MAVMATPQAEAISLDQKSLKLASPIEGLNGKAEVNGHISPVDIAAGPKTENGVNHKNDLSPAAKTPESGHIQNHDAFAANQAISDLPRDSDAGELAQAETASTGPPGDIEMADAPGEDIAAGDQADSAGSPARAPADEPSQAAEPAVPEQESAQPLVSSPAPDRSPGPRQEDVDMGDTRPQPDPISSAEQAESTQNTAASDPQIASSAGDLSLHPASMSNLAIAASPEELSIAVTADTSMADAPPQSPTKVSREREEDDRDEPAAKRAKIDSPVEQENQASVGQAIQVSTDAGPVSLFNADGSAKSLADPSLDNNPITPYQNRQLRQVLALVKKTKAGLHFKLPVSQLWPQLIDSYMEKVSEPIDINTMEKKLRQEDGYQPYEKMGDFKRDIQLLYDNCVLFNGPQHDVTKAAENVRETIQAKMAPIPAVEQAKPEKKENKHHPSRHTEARSTTQQQQQAQQTQQAAQQPVQQQQHQQQQPQQQDKTAQQAAKRQSRGAATSPVEKPVPAEQPVEAQAFAVPASGVPVIRRGSAKGDNDRPKRPLHPPKSKDIIGFEPKKKKKLPPELRFCEEVLTELQKSKYHDFNAPFLKPVDPVALHIPGYWSIVKKPMDLETMQTKLYEGSYSGSKDFEKDFRQIVKNSNLFNGPDHEVTQQALKLEDVFDREWEKKEQWLSRHAPAATSASAAQAAAASTSQAAASKDDESEEEDGNASENEEDPDDAKDQATLESMKKSLEEAQAKLNELITAKRPDMTLVETQQSIVTILQKGLVNHRTKMAEKEQQKEKKTTSKPKPAKSKKAAGGGAGAGGGKKAGGAAGGGGGRKSGGGGKKAAAKTKTMGALEKEVVAAGINDLDGTGLERAIDIIKTDTNQNENDSGELELDIEVLSNDALTKLYELITKAFPHLRAEKEKTFNPPPPPEPPISKPKSGKPKKNRPMGKAEQERRIAQLQELRAQIKRQGSGSQEPIPSVEQDGAAGSALAEGNPPPPTQDSDEESSEEE